MKSFLHSLFFFSIVYIYIYCDYFNNGFCFIFDYLIFSLIIVFIKGDVNSISIGANTTIGEDSVVHVAGLCIYNDCSIVVFRFFHS